jgi:pimeloyl-ACP methyl ester carboxylesterase
MTGPRYLYLHGFASSPESKKGIAFASHFEKNRHITLARLDLRVPALEQLRLTSMIDAVVADIGPDKRERAVVMGSSLGGLTAARAAERDPRICALVLLAPAFGLVSRWKQRVGDDGMREWKETGWRTMAPDPEGPPRLHYEFIRDADEVEAREGLYPDVRVPTLILHGTKDDVVPVEVSREFARGKSHVRLVEVDDGHQLYSSIDRTILEMDRFLFGA